MYNLGGWGVGGIIIHSSYDCSEHNDLMYVKLLAMFLVYIYCSINGSFKKDVSQCN